METKAVMEGKLQSEVSGSVIPIMRPLPLPKIPYDKEELTEIIEEITIPSGINAQITGKLENIEQQVLAIHNYQTKKNLEHFYQSIQTAILDIQNNANALYELTKTYHASLPNTLRQVILEWIAPLKAELTKRLEMPANQRVELELRTKQLYAEQSFVSREPQKQQALMQHLQKLKTLVLAANQTSPRCYISYAWASKENQAQEYWVQPFLSILYDHLTQAGIRVVMDIRDNKPGDNIYRFMQQYHEGDYIILIGTESLLQKHYGVAAHAVQTELSIINGRFEQDHKQFGQSRIYPMLISGMIGTSYPEIYDKYRTVRDARDQGYLESLKKLMDWLYEKLIHNKKQEYTNLWREFHEKSLGFASDAHSTLIEQELKLGYHRQQLDYLRQDIQYQSVQAQEEAKHSQTVSTKMIGVLMESIGNSPKTLFDENGQQFQRPYTNPDFVERHVLGNKITEYFKQNSQVLTLTANGLGGMGKTELAANYYLHPPRPYTLRAWFHAETKEQLYQQYIELVTSHPNGIKLPDIPVEEKIRQVKKWLEQQKDCLLVYDNVPNIKEIDGLLPEQGKHHILMTSRNEIDWPQHHKLSVDVMEEEESIELIVKMTGNQEGEEKLKELTNTLGYMPLALAQAGAYMAVKSLSIDDYLRLYKNHQAKFLSDKTPRTPKHEPIWITFDMNFQALEIDCPFALMTLKQASWLNCASIPEVLLQVMVSDSEQQKELTWIDIKEHVRKYSLMRINIEQHELNIHPLLQDILRSQQKKIERVQMFKEISNWLGATFSYYKEKNLGYRHFLSHAERLHQHAEEVVSLAKDEGNVRAKLLLLEPACLEYLYFNLGLADKALIFLEQKKKIHEEYYGKDHIIMESTFVNLGIVYMKSGKFKEARVVLQHVLTTQESRYGKNHAGTADALISFGNLCSDLREYESSREYLERALNIQEEFYGKDDIRLAQTLVSLGPVYLNLRRFETAKTCLERALRIQEDCHGKGHVVTAVTLVNIGSLYCLSKEKAYETAKKYLEEGLKIQENHYGENHVETAKILAKIYGVRHIFLGELKNPKEYLERILKIQKSSYAKDHPDIAETLISLGAFYYVESKGVKSKEMELAKMYYKKALSIREQGYGDDHIETGNALSSLGSTHLSLKEFKDAKACYKRALIINHKYYLGKNYPEIVEILMSLGRAYEEEWKETGEKERKEIEISKEYYKEALIVRENHCSNNDAEMADILKSLGNVHLILKEFKVAERYLERALKIKEDLCEIEGELVVFLIPLEKVCRELKKFEISKKYCDRVLKIEEGRGNIDTVSILLRDVGVIYMGSGQLQAAEEYLTRALKIQENHYGIDHVETAEILMYLAMTYAPMKMKEKCKDLLQRAEKIYHDEFPEGHVNLDKIKIMLKKLPDLTDKELSILSRGVPSRVTQISLTTLPANITPSMDKQQVINFNKQGMQHYKDQEFIEALYFFKMALDIHYQINTVPNKDLAILHFNIGTIHLKQEHYQNAHSHLNFAYKIRLKLLGETHEYTKKAKERLEECQSKKANLKKKKKESNPPATIGSEGLFFSTPLSTKEIQQSTHVSKNSFSTQNLVRK